MQVKLLNIHVSHPYKTLDNRHASATNFLIGKGKSGLRQEKKDIIAL